jgi:hypothetical protein
MQEGKRLESLPLPYIQTRTGAHKASYPVDPKAFIKEVRQSKQDTDHSPPASVKIMNVRSHTFTLPYTLLNPYPANMENMVSS